MRECAQTHNTNKHVLTQDVNDMSSAPHESTSLNQPQCATLAEDTVFNRVYSMLSELNGPTREAVLMRLAKV